MRRPTGVCFSRFWLRTLHVAMGPTTLAIDKTVRLEINGSAQRIRVCGERAGLAPILIVQAGPGLPLLHEVGKFRRRLRLESDFVVGYWEQRGCGVASQEDARSVSLQRQVDDLRAVLRWLFNETKQSVIVFGISLGATIGLRAVGLEPDLARSVIAISPDADTAGSDANAYAFLREHGVLAKNGGFSKRVEKLGPPPYTDTTKFQLRGRLLADLGGIEHGKKFGAVLRETLFGMIRTYGLVGTAKALRNMNLIQRQLLPELVSLNLLADPPRLLVPVHYVFGELDPLTPAAIVKELPAAITAPKHTAILVPGAGHMVHFDRPDVVRSIAMSARDAS
jgi:pimeloyl-ACP methyl ester carboxylesterase